MSVYLFSPEMSGFPTKIVRDPRSQDALLEGLPARGLNYTKEIPKNTKEKSQNRIFQFPGLKRPLYSLYVLQIYS